MSGFKDYRKEEEILRAYTGTHNLDEIYKMSWNTAEVLELMQEASK